MSEHRLTYRFGPLERRGILGPIRAGQAAVLGAGALAGIVVLDLSPTPAGALAAAVVVAVAALLSVLPVGRRTVEEWAPVALSFAARRLRGRACR